jgi:hypothetical protein
MKTNQKVDWRLVFFGQLQLQIVCHRAFVLPRSESNNWRPHEATEGHHESQKFLNQFSGHRRVGTLPGEIIVRAKRRCDDSGAGIHSASSASECDSYQAQARSAEAGDGEGICGFGAL